MHSSLVNTVMVLLCFFGLLSCGLASPVSIGGGMVNPSYDGTSEMSAPIITGRDKLDVTKVDMCAKGADTTCQIATIQAGAAANTDVYLFSSTCSLMAFSNGVKPLTTVMLSHPMLKYSVAVAVAGSKMNDVQVAFNDKMFGTEDYFNADSPCLKNNLIDGTEVTNCRVTFKCVG